MAMDPEPRGEQVPATERERCGYFWPDSDRCGLVEGHEGDHAVFGPKCGALSPEGVPCDQQWHHSFDHRTTLRWPRQAAAPDTGPGYFDDGMAVICRACEDEVPCEHYPYTKRADAPTSQADDVRLTGGEAAAPEVDR